MTATININRVFLLRAHLWLKTYVPIIGDPRRKSHDTLEHTSAIISGDTDIILPDSNAATAICAFLT